MFPRTSPTATASNQPTRAPPKNTTKNFPIPLTTTSPLNVPALRIPMSMVASTSEVASFSRLSPSTRTVSRSGTPNCLNIAMTATGSVALKMAPTNRAINTSKGEKNQRIKPIIAVEIRSPGTASVNIGTIFLPNCLAFRLKADSKIKVGINTNRTRSGLSSKWASDPKPGIDVDA